MSSILVVELHNINVQITLVVTSDSKSLIIQFW